jgi:hypothetical protein
MNLQFCFTFTLTCLLLSRPGLAQETAPELSPDEQKFVELLTEATLVGKFSRDDRPDADPKAEKYSILSVKKQSDENWIVESRVVYGDVDVKVPVPVQVKWAGDTPVLQLTNQAIPLLGSGFTARVLFYDNQYAGTWKHGQVGGQMWGRIEKSTDE